MTEKCFHETFSFWLVRPGPTYYALLQQRATGGGRKAVPVGREATTGIDSNARPDGGRKAVPSTPDRAWHPGPSV